MLETAIFSIKSFEDFERLAIKIFRYQYENTEVYRQFCDLLKVAPASVKKIENIPFLPIQFFKSHRVISEAESEAITFTSSGTTGSITSKHYVSDLSLYEKSFLTAFELIYGNPSQYVILALLPSYIERGGSSLVYMAASLIETGDVEHSGFYLNDTDALIEKLIFLESINQKTILIGVSYALLDLIEKQNFKLKNTIIMETGGMKGKRKELVKEELHSILKNGFGVTRIHSEYGMTELLSQAYSKGEGVFYSPPWMKIRTRDTEDALSFVEGKTGGINVIDLANLYSCSFIATQDLGKIRDDGGFEILGRFDASDIRGCNLMVQ
ncbi:MAG: phenylacetate-coenzyme A ligase PaaK-like adenylate-forming protein [Flavobacteriaceae bacterium]|jgi:phenylacetate-coenzyme A ligase PaaK-like adenylate-forming protein